MELRGKTVLITGGASGIGYLMGRKLLAEGAAHLVIWDLHEEAMSRVVAEFTALGHRVDGFHVDVAELVQVQETVRTMESRGIAVDVLINNAGVVVAIRKDRIFLRLPRIANLLPLLRGILPVRWFDRVVGGWLGVYRSMSTFRGRA